jgi:peptide subunit release factor RF-3
MAVERERGISVSSVEMNFEHEGLAFNLLDAPGHWISATTPTARDCGRQRG